MGKLDRTHWQLLAALSHTQTLSQAARHVHITQAAASQRLKEAERRLGIELVDRKSKMLSLNPAGIRLAQTAVELQTRLGNAEAEAIWLGSRPEPRITLVQNHHDNPDIVKSVAKTCLSPSWQAHLDINRTQAAGLEEAILTETADIAITPEIEPIEGIDSQVLLKDRLVAVLPADDPLAAKTHIEATDLTDRTYFTYSLFPLSGWEYERFFKPAFAYPSHIVKVESTQLILQLIGASMGVSLLPWLSTTTSQTDPSIVIKELSIKGLSMDPIEFNWCLLHRSHPLAPKNFELFSKELSRSLRRLF